MAVALLAGCSSRSDVPSVATAAAAAPVADSTTDVPAASAPAAAPAVVPPAATDASASTVASASQPDVPPVPAAYRSLTRALSEELAAFGAETTGTADGHPVAGAALTAADGNIGTGLLAPDALDTAASMLDALRSLGVGGVTIEVGFPLLLTSFPNSAGYVAFYRQVAQEIHADGLVLSVEANPLFVSGGQTRLHPDYHGLTVASYAAEQRSEAQTIIDVMHPTYLTILDEPDTFGTNLGLDLRSPSTGVSLIRQELDGLDRQGTLIGAGTGTWTNPAYDRALLTDTSIDYLSVHVYARGLGDFANLAADVAAARAGGRPAVMDETWLFKNFAGAGTGAAGVPEEQKLGTFSFFEPYDATYLGEILAYARHNGLVYVAPFDSPDFFAELDWTPALEAEAPGAVHAARNASAAAAIATSRRSILGSAYAALLR